MDAEQSLSPVTVRAALSRAGYRGARVIRRGLQGTSGHKVTKGASGTSCYVSFRAGDHLGEEDAAAERAEALLLYTAALTAAGFAVSQPVSGLLVVRKAGQRS
ncbi:hypothetical protein ACFWPU_01210 [Streptomyces sp. NPDC058471]|uniref:hypothetical protein n=1 Tax=Streptomyces sp. NPDC058471 TaxID=3346516 RepID=UPI0036535EB4